MYTALTRSELHHGPTNDISSPHPIKELVDLFELEEAGRVPNLVLSGERQHFHEIDIVAPIGAVERLLAVHTRKQRHTNAVTNQPDIGVVPANRKNAEAELHHFRCTRAVNDRIHILLARGLLEFCRDRLRCLVFDDDNVVGAVLLGNGQLVNIARERDNLGTAAKQFRVLNCVRPQSANAKNTDDSARAERASVALLGRSRVVRIWFQGPKVIKIDWASTSVTLRDDEKSETLPAPNPHPLLVEMNGNISTHQDGNDRGRLVHNHPSGNPTPSHADIQMTRQIIAVAGPLGIAVHDHIIVGRDGHASLRGLKLI